MRRYRITLQETGPHRWTWELSRLMNDGHVRPLCHGIKPTRDEAEHEAREWADWWHHDRTKGAARDVIDFDLE